MFSEKACTTSAVAMALKALPGEASEHAWAGMQKPRAMLGEPLDPDVQHSFPGLGQRNQ